jgi:hypothetical protein
MFGDMVMEKNYRIKELDKNSDPEDGVLRFCGLRPNVV